MSLNERINILVDRLSDFLAKWPGSLPLAGLLLVLINFLLQIFPGPGSGWIVDGNLFLHLGVIVTIIGMLLVRALSRD